MGNMDYGYVSNVAVSGDTPATTVAAGVFSYVVNTNNSNQGTRNTYAGYFSANGSANGTSTAYGLYVSAADADKNYALIVPVNKGLCRDRHEHSRIRGADQRGRPLRRERRELQHRSSNANMSVYDVAENFPSRDDIEYGDIVVLDPSLPGSFVRKSTGEPDEIVIGSYSEKPGLLLGGFNGEQYAEERQVAVALSGRIPVKVCLEGGPIQRGDPLTPSSLPGVGKKAETSDPVIGFALEPFDGSKPGTDRVLTFISLDDKRAIQAQQTIRELEEKIDSLESRLVLRSPGGSCFRVTVDDDGRLSSEPTGCEE